MNDLLRFDEAGEAEFGELVVCRRGSGFLVRGPAGVDNRWEEMDEDDAVFREWIRTTEEGTYRPLRGERSLRRGWIRVCQDEAALRRCLEIVYPLACVHVEQEHAGTLRVVSVDDVLGRQSGMYENAKQVSPGQQQVIRQELCGRCVRSPRWDGSVGTIPCPEPCSCFVACCKVIVGWGNELPSQAKVDENVGFAEFQRSGNAVREGILARLHAGHDQASGTSL